MDDIALARILHFMGVVLWIGGVAMVTTVLIPAARRSEDAEAAARFLSRIESGFARQARIAALLTGASGFYLLHRLDDWGRLTWPADWWVHVMILVWLVFTLLLFVIEPRAQRDGRASGPLCADLERAQRLHWILLAASLVAVAGAVFGVHDWDKIA
ncbi:MAG: hypothetical protein GWO16_11710 [Gammaproteobacteria bacterium]|nr:hypothetical protein [Gammaproteobacteria bacterium]NIR98594.1 hypothetical protein [Gammaproteobacteria bacterium]NIT64317.1 hypothetical protein [Gammaproteobacteria bacterium]NIV21241.1 hypothetical protein [Gammaproteobacteria bacterium]NIX10945.1 hypothetical protein [Gammaproteobacteria bacterium]